MKVVVVTPTLGTSRWLRETVESVRAHAPRCIHVLACPPEQVASLVTAFPQCVVVPDRGKEGGMYGAINAGLAGVADWSAFSYINDDDCLLDGFASALAEIHPPRGALEPLFVYGRVKLIDSKGKRLGAIPVSPAPSLNRVLYAQRLEPVYQHGTVVTRAAWEKVGGFDETLRFCGDSEYFARLCIRGVPAIRVWKTVAAFRLRPGQLTKQREAMIVERARVDAKLNLLEGPGAGARLWARFLFRTANLPVYGERIARHGFLSFDQILERAG